MTGRATTQAISATELTEGDSDTLRIRHRLEALADASNRIPRLVTPTAEDISVEPSGKAPATKRSRASSAAGRTRATKANETKANDIKTATPSQRHQGQRHQGKGEQDQGSQGGQGQ